MISPNPAMAFSFGNSINIFKQQNHTQRSALPWKNSDHTPSPLTKTFDTVLFGGPSHKKEAFHLTQLPKGYSVNNASTSEIPEFIDFIVNTIGKTEDMPIYEARCRHSLALGGYSYIIRDIKTHGKPIIGAASLNPNGYIVWAAVDKAHQGKGIATVMMENLIEKSKQAGMDKLYLGIEKENPHAGAAIRVSEKAGFKKTGENPELWLMELCLKQQAHLPNTVRNPGLQAGPRNGIHTVSRNSIQLFPRNGLQIFPHRAIQNLLTPLYGLKRLFH